MVLNSDIKFPLSNDYTHQVYLPVGLGVTPFFDESCILPHPPVYFAKTATFVVVMHNKKPYVKTAYLGL